ncbi:MAG TPA: hypothetical protein VLF60_01665 [Candidatus Saccharimonadales bacterium]|nr:hypothetical protein [Candidatus Saccharimonadales bacterium]
MSQYAAATMESRMWRRNQNTVRHQIEKGGLGPVAHVVLIALMLCVLGLIYLTQITKTSTYGYEIQKLQSQKTALADQKQVLQVEAARLQALDQVKKGSVGMVQPANTDYVQ